MSEHEKYFLTLNTVRLSKDGAKNGTYRELGGGGRREEGVKKKSKDKITNGIYNGVNQSKL